MSKASPEQNHAANINVDAFLALSNVGFSSLERLAALNLNATRAALEDSLAASSATLQSKDLKSLPSMESITSSDAAKNAAAYLKSVQEVVAETQKEVTNLMNTYLSSQSVASSAPADWTKGFDMFKSFGQQITAMAEANSSAVSAATARMTDSATSQLKKHR